MNRLFAASQSNARSAPATAPIVRRFRNVGQAAARIALFTVAVLTTGLPLFSPTFGQGDVRVISPPLAILFFAWAWLPRREAPFYALIYAIVAVGRDFNASNVAFDTVETLIGMGEALALALLVPPYLSRKQMILQPMRVIAFIAAALGVALVGASSAIMAATMFDLSASDYIEEFGGKALLAWRNWWLGDATSFVTIGGTLTFVWQVSRQEWRETFGARRKLNTFLGYGCLHLLVTVFTMPLPGLVLLDLPPDVRLGFWFAPIMTALVLTGAFKGFGAAAAIITLTTIGVASTTSARTAFLWAGLPPMVTPLQLMLIATAAICWVLAVNLRHLQWAVRNAVEASEMKSRFIAMLNHELRTPLNAILGFSELMRLKSVRELDDAIGPIENIHASGQRLLAMIEGLLSQADHGASVFDLNKRPLHVAGALSGALADIQAELDELGCGVTLAIAEDLVVDADPRALKQMLLVLLSYPLRFVSPETVISVSAAHYGTDTIIEVNSRGLIHAATDDRDKLEMQLVEALALAHGARLKIVQSGRNGRIARLTFFATRAAA